MDPQISMSCVVVFKDGVFPFRSESISPVGVMIVGIGTTTAAAAAAAAKLSVDRQA